MLKFSTREIHKLLKLSQEFIKVRIFEFLISGPNYYLLGAINCVRWSPSGDMLATASNDQTVKILDFKTGKELYTETTMDRSKFWLWKMT